MKEEKDWTLVIKPQARWLDLHLRDLWRYRDLIGLFVRRDFVAIYKQTVLGPLWYVIRPLLTTITYTFIFSNVAKLSTDGLPPIVFYMLGIVTWSYFADCLNKTSDTFVGNAQIFGKVYFPRLAIPISVVISNLISFGIQFLVFLLLMAYFYFFASNGKAINPNAYILLLPVLVLIMAALGLGMGIIVSSMTTKYRDFKFLVSFGVQLLMFASPVIYPLSTVSGNFRNVLLLNPMTSVIETFKFAFLGSGTMHWSYLAYSAVFAVVVLIIGMLVFSKVEKSFMDTV